jgi:hypothetical protein
MSSIHVRRFVPVFVVLLTLCLAGPIWARPGGGARPGKERAIVLQGLGGSVLDVLLGLFSRFWAASESQPNPSGEGGDLSQSPPPSPGDNGAQLDPHG